MIISNINVEYDNKIIYKNAELELLDNKINCIVGKSGSGKTTLINFIADYFIKNDIRFSYIFQEDRLIPWLNVYDNLKFIGRELYGHSQLDEKISKVLEIVDLEEVKELYPSKLSVGMKERVNIARGLIRQDSIILMDEPFRSIDSKCKIKIIQYIKGLEDTTILLITHDDNEVRELAERVFFIDNNTSIAQIRIVKKNDENIII